MDKSAVYMEFSPEAFRNENGDGINYHKLIDRYLMLKMQTEVKGFHVGDEIKIGRVYHNNPNLMFISSFDFKGYESDTQSQ